MKFFFIILSISLSVSLLAQDNYEIQVYGSPTMPVHTTMLELHSNFTFNGQTQKVNGVLPTNHILHETIEITHGFTPWFETGFYFFNAIGSNHRSNYVGSHIRPRVMAPKSWNWPVGVSLSAEIGYQKPEYSEDDWSLEIRPIIDKQIGRLYVSLNPTLEKSLHGINSNAGYIFSPNVKAGFNFTSVIAAGVEYYGSLGAVNHFSKFNQQEHLLFAAIDLSFSSDWEFNCGYGWGLTPVTDKGIFKVILGRRFKH